MWPSLMFIWNRLSVHHETFYWWEVEAKVHVECRNVEKTNWLLMTVTGLFSMQQILACCVGPLASVLPHICNTTVVGTWSWSTRSSFPAWGWRQLFVGWGEEEEENNQECWKENDSWKQLEIIPHKNNYSVLFVLDHLHESASNETVISAETEESCFTHDWKPISSMERNNHLHI